MKCQLLSILLIFPGAALGESGSKVLGFKSEKPIGEWTFETMKPEDRTLVNGFFEELDTKYAALDKYALRCNGEYSVLMGLGYERFGFLHAEDRLVDKERHIFFRKFVKDDDERLLKSPGGDVFGNSDKSGFPVHPVFGDRLRIKDITHIQQLPGKKVESKLLGISFDDRYFSPLACCLLPYGNFFSARNSRGEPDIGNREEMTGFCRFDKYVGVRIKVRKSVTEKEDLGYHICIAFNGGLPVSFESWMTWGTSQRMLSRTDTRWQEYDGEMLPAAIEATSFNDPGSLSWVSAEMEWKLGKKVPEALFAVEDLEKRRDLNW